MVSGPKMDVQHVYRIFLHRSVLFGQWGFAVTEQQGITVLLHGAPGTGKTLAAEAIGYEVGKPLKVHDSTWYVYKICKICV